MNVYFHCEFLNLSQVAEAVFVLGNSCEKMNFMSPEFPSREVVLPFVYRSDESTDHKDPVSHTHKKCY